MGVSAFTEPENTVHGCPFTNDKIVKYVKPTSPTVNIFMLIY